MKIDSIGNCVLDLNDVVDHLMAGGSITEVGCRMFDFSTSEYNDLVSAKDHDEWRVKAASEFITVHDLDNVCKNRWMIPESYIDMDIEDHVYKLCDTETEVRRVEQELTEFKSRDLLIVLKALKYLVDTMRQEHILWGVGRGSSVASYCLYLLGVHSIDSIKYNLDFKEFLD